jgi:hypothetical protein
MVNKEILVVVTAISEGLLTTRGCRKVELLLQAAHLAELASPASSLDW